MLTHPDTFSSSIYDQIMGPVMGRTLLELEGAEHRASRALVSPSFRTALLERWRTELVEVVVHELIDRFAPRGRAELAREFTFAFPVQVIARIMGLPREDYVRFQRLSIELLNVVYDWDMRHRRIRDAEDVLRGDPRRTAASPAGRPDQHAGGIRDRRRAADRRRDLRVPAADPARRRRDDLPRLGQPAGRDAHRAGAAGRSCGRIAALLRGAFEEALRWEPPITTVVRRGGARL